MTNIVHLHERQMRDDDYIGYSSGITGFRSPGPCSIACLLIAPDGRELTRELVDTGIHGSGHDAEYLALTLLSRVVMKQFVRVHNLRIFCSNQLVVNQLSGRWQVHVDRHRQFVKKITSTLCDIHWGITWLPARDNPLKAWHWEHANKQGATPEAKQQHA